MPIVLASVGGAALSYWLIDTELAIPAFIWMVVFIALLFMSPPMAWWMLGLTVAAAALVATLAAWQYVLGVVLGFIMFFFLVVGLIHAL